MAAFVLLAAFVLSQFLPYMLRVNDDPESRRRFYREFQKRQDPKIPEEWRTTPKDIILKERYWVNDRGMCLMTTTIEPADKRKIRAVACFCHGYGDNGFAYLKRVEFFRYVRAGIAVVNMEIEGHGRSDGMLGLVPSFDRVIDDVSTFFREVVTKKFPGKKCFLVGESMGGAISLKTYNRHPEFFSGVVFIAPMCKLSDKMLPPVFIAPMCKLSDKMLPPEWVVNLLQQLLGKSGDVNWLGELPVAHYAPIHLWAQAEIDTARECLDLTSEISKHLAKRFDAPFLIQHGSNDMVTCPKLSQMLYDESPSKDKEIKIYDGMWHNLLGGEPIENIDLIFNDSIKWILDRS
eukprot:CAMPEP_0178626470 /NCGR_PEP_ID=MMETSP0698-20121128/8415_1 /TAXON_ID=265572 /ORGANISM="Extubocellulus spinifer, Strain CCMP396" /LENGTH=347 /DNA_ID=CAMNT_0020265675 /DNA_START=71 /DNA_END=1116 /DNA_ORIENTATION=+